MMLGAVAAAICLRPHAGPKSIQRAGSGHWEPPGGLLELGGTIEDGLRLAFVIKSNPLAGDGQAAALAAVLAAWAHEHPIFYLGPTSNGLTNALC